MSTTPNGPDPTEKDASGAGARRYGEGGEPPVTGPGDLRGDGLGEGGEIPASRSEDLRRAEADVDESGATAYDEAQVEETGHPTGAEEWRGPVDEGSVRYGETLDEIPVSGSEESWSARPHPGFQPRPAGPGATKRLAAGVLVGGVLLAVGVWGGYSLLTAKSPNGNGAAPWTAGVTDQGAVVQGINAQNNVGSNNTTLGVGDQVRVATAACDAATGDSSKLTSATGTVATPALWSAQAAPTVTELRGGGVKLASALNAGDVARIATSAQGICGTLTTVSALPALSDPAAASAWSAAVTDYAAAANNALKGANGNQSALIQAKTDVVHANDQLNALTTMIGGTA